MCLPVLRGFDPARGIGAGLVLPYAKVDAMNLHLQETIRWVSRDAFAVMMLDGVGWHQTGDRLVVPENIGPLRLPAYSPELNPVETSGSFSDKTTSAIGSLRYEAVVDACCDARNKLRAASTQIRSIATRDWAKTVGS